VYPKARVVLEQIRDKKADAVLSRSADRALFHDVVAKNRVLGCEQNTHTLFNKLVPLNRELARKCVDLALPALVRAGDFELAEQFLPDPEHQVRKRSNCLNRTVQAQKQARFSRAPRFKAEIHNYAESVKQMLAILEGCGRKVEAASTKSLASQLIQATTIREAVAAALEPNARPWFTQSPHYRKSSKKMLRAWHRN
jgi:hypothetical protein